ncbi:MAG TPA: CDP-glycerol glycerophosphotransferase family protein [Candidatus Moranbacteria bacterium]|nr:CDP-glycerol glycerophosphotransferase family protein [Candidatus Moranbacteria bacterium]HSA08596.1 CDP-glycerol glycerophosphotransferase family protein [Candidatus Moranbacteria bacterium]
MKKNNLFFSFVIKIIFFPLHLIGFLIPKNNNLWVFGSWKGEKFSDNPRALFEFVNEKKDIRAVWLTKSDKVYNDLIKRGYECHKFYSLKGICLCLIAKVAVVAVSYFDVSPFIYLFPWKLKIIQLWHGTPLKNLNNKYVSKGELFLTELFLMYLTRPMDLIFSATDLNKKIYSELFKIKEEKIKITGQPRNDLMLAKRSSEEEIDTDKQKTILYLPTWREYDSNHDLFFQYGFDIQMMNEFLKKINAKLLIKFHAIDSMKNKILGVAEKEERIRFIDIDDVYEILGEVDVLITDYSSVYFDFLLLDRPIVFASFDLDMYEKERGFYYDYKTVAPGLKAQTWPDIILQIEQSISKDMFKEEREKTNKIFNHWQDGKSSERVYDEIVKIIN